MKRETTNHTPQPAVPRDRASDEDGLHSSQDVPRERGNDARTSKGPRPSRDVDPDSAESMIDRDDTSDEP